MPRTKSVDNTEVLVTRIWLGALDGCTSARKWRSQKPRTRLHTEEAGRCDDGRLRES
jgi:hypothetical protein